MFFLHGCPDCRLAARPGHEAARRTGTRLVAVSRPGYGLSDPHESGHLSVADDTVAVADTLGVERFAVLGMSVGGPYALACAAKHPDRVTAVGLVASPGMAPEMDPPWHRDDLSPESRAFFFTRVAESTAAEELFRPDYEEYVGQVAPYDTDDAALAQRALRGQHPQDAEILAALPPQDLAEQFRESLTDGYLRDAAMTFRRWEFRPEDVRCPVRLWYGELDQNAPVRNGHWLAGRIADATLTLLPDTAHLSALHRNWDGILESLRMPSQP